MTQQEIVPLSDNEIEEISNHYHRNKKTGLRTFCNRIMCHEINSLIATIRKLQAENEKLEKALNKIASWKEGQEVNGSFDEPGSAQEARKALK